ncbi:MAG: hypothetical protein ACTSUO_07090 [Candidatus Thorarchaeota archaeon]
MMAPKDLRTLYGQIISEPPKSNGLSDDEGSVSLLLQTEWVRILILRDIQENSSAILEVESSLPELGNPADGNEQTAPSSNEGHNHDLNEFAQTLISHLNYLIRLSDYGFKLDFVGPEYLWIASYEIENPPSLKFFELLVPPS